MTARNGVFGLRRVWDVEKNGPGVGVNPMILGTEPLQNIDWSFMDDFDWSFEPGILGAPT